MRVTKQQLDRMIRKVLKESVLNEQDVGARLSADEFSVLDAVRGQVVAAFIEKMKEDLEKRKGSMLPLKLLGDEAALKEWIRSEASQSEIRAIESRIETLIGEILKRNNSIDLLRRLSKAGDYGQYVLSVRNTLARALGDIFSGKTMVINTPDASADSKPGSEVEIKAGGDRKKINAEIALQVLKTVSLPGYLSQKIAAGSERSGTDKLDKKATSPVDLIKAEIVNSLDEYKSLGYSKGIRVRSQTDPSSGQRSRTLSFDAYGADTKSSDVKSTRYFVHVSLVGSVANSPSSTVSLYGPDGNIVISQKIDKMLKNLDNIQEGTGLFTAVMYYDVQKTGKHFVVVETSPAAYYAVLISYY
jgi:hypothetical protein